LNLTGEGECYRLACPIRTPRSMQIGNNQTVFIVPIFANTILGK
jgi:hypothetical protein